MPKKIILTSVLFLIGLSYAIGHLIDEELQNFQYNAEFVKVAPIVDGYLDDPVWEDALAGKLEQEISSGYKWTESDDFTGSFKAVWRGEFLYIAIKIQDDHIESYQSKPYMEDQLIIHVDEFHFQRKSDLHRYEIPVGVESGALKAPLSSIAWGNDGKTCELSFRLGDIADKDNVIGFSIVYHDVDSGHLQNKIAWGPEGYTELNELLPDLVFTAKINPNSQQKLIRWGQIKRLY